ncbi:Tyrosine recombinase XerC [Pseudoalteromonas sp. THAF3]|uniref:tyrosine-type recombinase/integrase n=1 Tax=Pseudoalteromonas sp. THAF3 TaxID=2587843 RepID=UPI001267F60C|nr:site-specific integrase [Pseudoalteromonas sp. THAF3]QFU04601.1 Tyrosine recombinase XerC [Pseudoalteromonas sp. THAF3]
MAISPRGDSFRVSVTHKGQRFRRTVKTYEEAVELEKKIRLDFLGGKDPTSGIDGARNKVTMKDLYLRVRTAVWRSMDSKPRRNAELVLDLMDWWEVSPADITAEKLSEAWDKCRELGNSESTVNRKKAALSKMFSFAVSELGWLDKKPGGLKQTKERQGRIRYLTEFEEARFLKIAEQLERYRLRSLVIFMLDTGARVSEALAIEPRDITEKGVYLDTKKGGTHRLIPLTRRAREHVLKWNGLTQNMVNDQWDRVRDLMGHTSDPEFVPHSCRHTCASRLVQGGMDLRRVKDWMGHKTISTTMRYAHLNPEALAGGLDILEKEA